MNLRDHFAGQAMSAMLAKLISVYSHEGTRYVSLDADSDIARWSYRMADAMIKQSEKKEGET